MSCSRMGMNIKGRHLIDVGSESHSNLIICAIRQQGRSDASTHAPAQQNPRRNLALLTYVSA